MSRLLEAGETILCRDKKSLIPIVFMIIAFPIWLYVSYFLLAPAYRHLVLGEAAGPPLEYYIAGMAGLLVFLPAMIAIFLSYALNRFIITDRKIYIRRGLSGKSVSVRLDDIRSFQCVTAGRMHAAQRIDFYLLNGSLVKTGKLYGTFGSLQAMLEQLRSRFEGRGFTRQERHQLKVQNPQAPGPVVRTNVLAPILLALPFAAALAFTAVFLLQKPV